MTALPTLPSPTVGNILEPADLNNMAACVTFLMAKPIGRWESASVGQSVTGTAAAIQFDTENYDFDGIWVIGNPTKFIIVTPGWYKLRYSVVTTSTSLTTTTYVQATSGSNNPGGGGNTFGPFWGSDETGSAGGSKGTGCSGLWPYYLYAGDYLQLFAASSGTDAVDAVTAIPTFFALEYISMQAA